MEKWDNCSFKVKEEYLEDRVCYGGLDLSSDPVGNIKTDKEKKHYFHFSKEASLSFSEFGLMYCFLTTQRNYR